MRTVSLWLVISSVVLGLALEAAARTRPRYGGTLKIETQSSGFTETTPGYELLGETLTQMSRQGKPEAKITQRWESQSGERRWQFWLRPNIRMHDGTVLDAGLAAQILTGKTGAPWRSVRAVGDVLIFEGDAPMPDLPAQLAMPHFSLVTNDAAGTPVGTGPMKATRITPGGIALIAFDDYWAGRTFLDGVEISMGRSVRDQWLDLTVGRADLVEVPAETVRRAQQEHLKLLSGQNTQLVALVFDANSAKTQDVKVRRALAYSVDRNALLNFIFQKQGQVSAALLPGWLTGYAMLFPPEQRLSQAKDLRIEAGQIGTLTIGYPAGDPALQLVAERIALTAREAGMTLQPQAIANGVRTDVAVVRTNLVSLDVSVALDAYARQFGLGSINAGESAESAYQAERDILSSARVVPLLYVPKSYALRDRLRGLELEPDGQLDCVNAFVEDRK